jgi:predicted PurR-regulated permease PerM
MELLIVILVTCLLIGILMYVRLYMSATATIEEQHETIKRKLDYQEKLTKEIEHYKAVIRTEQSIHQAQVFELDKKLQAISAILNPEPACFQSYDVEDSLMANVLSRHE